MKRARDWLGGSDEEVEDGDFDAADVLEMTAPHPWGVKPWGNFHWDGNESKNDARSKMGLFELLDDAILLSVLGFLCARSITRLGQACRALAVFCNHEPLWRDLLTQSRGGGWKWTGSFRNTLVMSLGGGASTPFVVDGLYSDLLNKSWLCATARFNRSWLGTDTVPRERAEELSLEEFVRKYERPNKPVIITGIVRKWPL
jgi:hypothetical protein